MYSAGKGLDNGRHSYYSSQIYRDGGAHWVVRNVMSNAPEPGSAVVRVEGGKSEVVFRTIGEYVTGLVRHPEGMYALI